MSVASHDDLLVSKPLVHPVYGEYTSGWKPVPGFPGYEVNELCQVKGKRLKRLLSVSEQGQVGLIDSDRKRRMKHVCHLALHAFFPGIAANESVDHIDEDYTNNHLNNLQWLSRSENIRKSHQLNPRNAGPSQSKVVWWLSGKKGKRIQRFLSLANAAKVTGIPMGSIQSSARSMGRYSAHGKYFSYEDESEQDLPGEEWKTSPALDAELNQTLLPAHKKVMVSNFGRIRTRNGIKRKGHIKKRKGNGKYRVTGVDGKIYYDHALIFLGFHDIPYPKAGDKDENGEPLVLCHNDNAPLDDAGAYRNFPKDLRIGTQSDNMNEHHQTKRRKLGS